MLSLLPLEAACYYGGSHLLDALGEWEYFLKELPVLDGCVAHVIQPVPYWSLLAHVKKQENREWYRRHPACEMAVGNVFASISGPLAEAFPAELYADHLEELREIARAYPVVL